MNDNSRKVLVSGFEPFGGFSTNPSAAVATALSGQTIAGHHIHTLVLPVVFGEAAGKLVAAIDELNPALVMCLGLAAERQAITVERIAINLMEARLPDNAGNQPREQAVVADGPAAYWSSLPVSRIVAALQARGYVVEASLSAGSYVCNEVFYQLMHHCRESSHSRCGFIHLPAAESGGSSETNGMSITDMTAAVSLAVASCLQGGQQGIPSI